MLAMRSTNFLLALVRERVYFSYYSSYFLPQEWETFFLSLLFLSIFPRRLFFAKSSLGDNDKFSKRSLSNSKGLVSITQNVGLSIINILFFELIFQYKVARFRRRKVARIARRQLDSAKQLDILNKYNDLLQIIYYGVTIICYEISYNLIIQYI